LHTSLPHYFCVCFVCLFYDDHFTVSANDELGDDTSMIEGENASD